MKSSGKITGMAAKKMPNRQRGATLIVALVMLLLISLLAVGGMQGSILQERMASNAHDGSIAFQASEAALRQAEADLINNLNARQTASGTARLTTPWAWDGANPAKSGDGNVGVQVNSEPVYHLARLADVCPIDPTEPCFERFLVTSRGEGGSAEAVVVIQSTVLLPPE